MTALSPTKATAEADQGRAGGSARKLRVLVSAEACNPSWPSVPLVGYNFARALAGRDDLEVVVATHVRNRDALDGGPLAGRVPIHFIDNDFIAKPIFHIGKGLRGGTGLGWTLNTALMWPGYMVYERMLFRRFRADLTRGRFDLIHRITPLTPVLGSPITRWTDVPVVIGPLNGGLPWPPEFPEVRRNEREWLAPLRGAHARLPYHRSTFRRAAAVIAASRHTASEIPGGDGLRFQLPENGVDPDRFPPKPSWTAPRGPYRFVTVGRLAPVKMIHLILEAMAGSDRLRGCRLSILGDGPERGRLEGLAAERGLGEQVEFAGWLGQDEVAARLRDAQAFVFPSIKDFGGGAALEAMANALPAIVCDYGGPAELVGPDCGLRLPLEAADRLVVSLRAAMERLAADHTLSRALGEAGARRIAESFVWEAKADRLVDVYRQCLARRAARR